MDSKKYEDLLKRFLDCKISLSDMSAVIDDRLFQLRKTPNAVTDEEDFLSGIELMICEFGDGFRSFIDFEEYVKSLIKPEPPIFVWGSLEKLPVILSSASNRDASENIQQENMIKDFALPVLPVEFV